MDAEMLENFIRNEKPLYEDLMVAIRLLRAVARTAASEVARANAEWHDDPAADDHAAFHAPANIQFPQEMRDEAIRSLVDHYLAEFAIGAAR